VVEAVISAACSSVSIPAIRSFISRAALLVKVTARIFEAGVPVETSQVMRATIVRVFPVPAPARISRGPVSWVAARCCSGLRS